MHKCLLSSKCDNSTLFAYTPKITHMCIYTSTLKQILNIFNKKMPVNVNYIKLIWKQEHVV